MTEIVETCLSCGGPLAPVVEDLWDDRFGAPGRYSIARCGRCALEQTVPRPEPTALRALYERYYNFEEGEDRSRSLYARVRERFFGSPLYRLWLALDGDVSFHLRRASPGRPELRLLDVGCNEGRGLLRYRANGFRVEGLEPNRRAADAARARGFTVHAGDVSELASDRRYDVVVLSNVLEHALDPAATLDTIRPLLTPGGEIWLSFPNGASIFRSLFRRRWINWHVPYHLTHFSPKTIRDLLDRSRFTVTSIDCVTPALWIAQSIVVAVGATPGRPTRALRRSALVGCLTLAVRLLFFPVLWLANRTLRGDCLRVRIRAM